MTYVTCLLCKKDITEEVIIYSFNHVVGPKEHYCECALCSECLCEIYEGNRFAMNAMLYSRMEALDNG